MCSELPNKIYIAHLGRECYSSEILFLKREIVDTHFLTTHTSRMGVSGPCFAIFKSLPVRLFYIWFDYKSDTEFLFSLKKVASGRTKT